MRSALRENPRTADRDRDGAGPAPRPMEDPQSEDVPAVREPGRPVPVVDPRLPESPRPADDPEPEPAA